MNRTALVFGATGMVGLALVKELIANKQYTSIMLFVRRNLDISDERLSQIIINYDNMAEMAPLAVGHDLYCCLGTTMAKAGSKLAFRRVDYDYPVQIGQIAIKNGVENYTLISSIGASKSKFSFYLNTKFETEEAIRALNFKRFNIVRPSLLLGDRDEKRTGEKIGIVLDKLLSPLYFGKMKKYAGIQSRTVARAMIQITLSDKDGRVYESDELQILGK